MPDTTIKPVDISMSGTLSVGQQVTFTVIFDGDMPAPEGMTVETSPPLMFAGIPSSISVPQGVTEQPFQATVASYPRQVWSMTVTVNGQPFTKTFP